MHVHTHTRAHKPPPPPSPAPPPACSQVQRNWMYLEVIFIGSEDIRKQLPQESIMFEGVHNMFMKLMKQLATTGEQQARAHAWARHA